MSRHNQQTPKYHYLRHQLLAHSTAKGKVKLNMTRSLKSVGNSKHAIPRWATRRVWVAAPAAALAATLSPLGAYAATSTVPVTVSHPVVIKVAMRVIKAGVGKLGGQVVPLNTVGGNCGTAYAYINPAGNGDANISVGFNLDITANWYTASTYAYGTVENNFTNNSGWLGFLGSGSNSYSNDFQTYLGPGFASIAAYMTAETASGEECASNWPTDSTYLY